MFYGVNDVFKFGKINGSSALTDRFYFLKHILLMCII
jgi:hypothetical protein